MCGERPRNLQLDRFELGAGAMRKRHRQHATCLNLCLGNYLRPPSDQALRFYPEGLTTPLFFQHEDHVPSLAQCLALGVVVLLESVDGHNAPRPCHGQFPNPVHILSIRSEEIGEMNNFFNIILDRSA